METLLIAAEWNFGLWAMFSAYNREIAKESYKKGYRFAELRKDDSDITYLKHKPTSVARNTKIVALTNDGSLRDLT